MESVLRLGDAHAALPAHPVKGGQAVADLQRPTEDMLEDAAEEALAGRLGHTSP